MVDEVSFGVEELFRRRRHVAASTPLVLLQRVASTVAASFDLSSLDLPKKIEREINKSRTLIPPESKKKNGDFSLLERKILYHD